MVYRISKKVSWWYFKNYKILPALIQGECTPYSPCDDLRVELDKIKCCIEDWSPISRGNQKLLNEGIFIELGKNSIKFFHKLCLDGIN